MLSDHLQVIVAAMTATSKRSSGGMSTDFSKFSKQTIDEVAKKLKDSQAQFQLKYVCIKNKMDPFGSHFMDSGKMGYSKDDLAKAHKNCDQQYTTKVNRQFITLIHNVMFPTDSKPTPDILRLQDLLDSSTVKGLMEGMAVGNEDQWDEDHMWLIPFVTIRAHLCLKYEVMTELIHDKFIEDFGILLGSATGESKTRKSFYEIDKEFELMTKTI